MSQFLGVSTRGGFQSESLSDGIISISSGKIENATSINGIPIRKISENSARLASLENKPSVASVLENATSIGGVPLDRITENSARLASLENKPSVASILENATSIGGVPIDKITENSDRISTLENTPDTIYTGAGDITIDASNVIRFNNSSEFIDESYITDGGNFGTNTSFGTSTVIVGNPSDNLVLNAQDKAVVNAYLGVGITHPKCYLHVQAGTSEFNSSNNFGSGGYIRSSIRGGGANLNNNAASGWFGSDGHPVSIYAEGSIFARTGYIVASDERIKTDIRDVPVDLALQQVRGIQCRYYSYMDSYKNGTAKTVGFIAQQVKEVLPMAVKIISDFIPNVLKMLEDCIWIEELVDDKIIYKLSNTIFDGLEIENISFKFFVKVDLDAHLETEVIVKGNTDNTFSFDNKYPFVYCYGSEINDFHSLDKDKIFTLHHAAIQSIDTAQLLDRDNILKLQEEIFLLRAEILKINKILFGDSDIA